MVKETHNLVARFGVSRGSGGTRPFDSAVSEVIMPDSKISAYHSRDVRGYNGKS
jgi:hypothetical protein